LYTVESTLSEGIRSQQISALLSAYADENYGCRRSSSGEPYSKKRPVYFS